MKRFNRFQLDHGSRQNGAVRMLSDRVDARLFDDGRRTTVINLAREVTFHDGFYGKVELTRDKFQSMIRNFEADVYGQKIMLDVAHRSSEGSAGEIKRLFLDGAKFRGEVEFTDYGLEAVQKRGMVYLSIDFSEDYEDPETRVMHGPVLFGAALTTRPRVKRLDPIELSFDRDEDRALMSPRIHQLFDEEKTQMDKFLKKLRDRLEAKKLSSDLIDQILAQYKEGATKLGDQEPALEALCEAMATTGENLAKQLADSGQGSQTIKLDFSSLKLPEPTGQPGDVKALSEEDVKKLMADAEAERERKRQEAKQTLESRVKLFTEALDANETVKQLSEDARNQLLAAKDLITGEMTDEQVKRLAEHQIGIGAQLAVSAELASMGYAPQGSPRITMDETNTIKQLQESMDERLGLADRPEAQRYAGTGGQLHEQNKKFAEQVLAQYDRDHAPQLHREQKQLAGGDGVVSDTSVPASWERTVIREALYNLVGLQFVNMGTAEFSTSIAIPFSYRDQAAAGRNNTRVHEGSGIPRAGVIQTADTAYPIPQKLSFLVSDELRYLSGARHIDWESVAENQQNASRIIQEDLEQLIFNEMLNAADEYLVWEVSNEAHTSDLDGSNNIFALAEFPVVRPRRVYDLQGNQIGNTQNPVTVVFNDGGGAETLDEYNPHADQAAGNYFQMDYNTGELRIVDENGDLVTPADANTTLVVSYSYTTNVGKFDTDLPADTAVDAHWDTFLYRYGLRKAEIRNNRWHTPNYGLMSGTTKVQIEQARKFAANYLVPGTSLEQNGNLGRIKDVPNFDTQAPGLLMGDQRVVIGERGITRLRMMKPWTLGELQDARNSDGLFIGKKEAYGDQFIALHTPTPLKRAATSLVLYSSTGRVTRAAA